MGSVDGDPMFSSLRGRSPKPGYLKEVSEWINHWLWRQDISLHWGNMDWSSFRGNLRARWNSVIPGDLVYWGLPRGMSKKALKKVISLHRGPVGGIWTGASLGGIWEQGEILLYQETLFIGNSREVCQRRLWRGSSLFIGAPLGEYGLELL